MARIIGEIRPEYAFVENSPMLTLRGLGVVLGDLASMGYDARWGVLGAHNAGAPHKRDRIWILAYANMQRMDIRGKHTTAPVASGFRGDNRARGINDGGWDSATGAHGDVGHSMQRGRTFGCIQSNRGISRQGSEAFTGASPRTFNAALCEWWKAEPELGRVVNGMADDMDRLAALGNGQVPAVAALAWTTLSGEIE